MHAQLTRKVLAGVTIGLLALGAGCTGDPEAAKLDYLESGRQYFEQGEYDKASIQFRNALQLDPGFEEGRYRLGLTYLALKNWSEAFQAFNAVVDQNPRHLKARLELAELWLASKKSYEARVEILAVQEIQPKSVRAQVLLAKSYLTEKDFRNAIDEFEKAKRLAPDQLLVWSASGIARVAAQQYQAAESDFRRALELDPSSAEAYRNLANLFRKTRREHLFEPFLERALQTNPDSLELYLVLANFHYEKGNMQAVDRLFDRLKARPQRSPRLALQLGDFWMWRKELVRAVEEYEKALTKGSNPLVERKLASAYITLGRWDEAERTTQKILADDPEDLQGLTFRAALRHLRGDASGAEHELRAVLQMGPNSPFANYYLGLALMEQAKLEEAQIAFHKCIEINPQFAEAFEKLAEIRLERGDWELGVHYAQKAVSLQGQNPQSYLLLAQAYLYQGDANRAEQVLNRLQTSAPDSPIVEELLGTTYVLQGKVQKGFQTYERAWERSQQPVGSLSRFVDVFVARGRTQQALRRVQRIIARDPRPGYYEILARLHLNSGRLRDAQAACREALRLDEASWVSHFYLAQISERQNKPGQALAHYNEVIQRQPDQSPPYTLAGDIQLRQGAFDEARSYYEQAAKLAPGSPITRHSLARLWGEEGNNLDEALTIMHGLQRKFPDDPNLSDTLGWIYYGKGIYPAALSQLRRSVELQPRKALFRYHLGMIYEKMGEPELSRQSLETALRSGLKSSRWEMAAQSALRRLSTQNVL